MHIPHTAEQLQCKGADRRSDIWAMGASLSWVVAGPKTLNRGEAVTAEAIASEAFTAVITKALQTEQNDRWFDADQVSGL